MSKVFIGVGHGGADSGAVGNGLLEKNLNLEIALSCRDELVRHGIEVKMSRETDESDTLNEEIKECNAYGPDLAVDIHNNAGGGDGVETWHHFGGGTGKVLAENILAEVVKLGQNSRGAKTKKNSAGKDYYGFIRMTEAPAVIVECAFIDTPEDIAIVDEPHEQKAMGIAIAHAILKTLGVAVNEQADVKSETTETATQASKLYRVQVGAYAVKENAEKMRKRLMESGFDAIIV